MVEYKITFSDKSFMYVDDTFRLCLFKDYNHKPIRVNIKDYLDFWHIFLNNYFFMDQISENNQKLLAFSIIKAEDRKDLPLNTRYKMSNDIEVGDIVEGPDGPRTVKNLHRGEEAMYEIDINGVKYNVNEGHVLHLIDKDDPTNVLDIQVGVYMHMDDEFKSHWVMEKIIN